MTPLTLRHGDLSFSAHAAGAGPTVLCLHGFPDHSRSFRFQLPAFARAGYRGVAATLRGYEPSSLPSDGDYRWLRMAEDVVGWIDDLGVDRVHLVGHDWGAVIGYCVAALWPRRLHSLTTLAVAHPGRLAREIPLRRPGQLAKSWYMLFFQMRGVADAVVARRSGAFIERLWHDWSPGWELPESEMASIKATFARPGVVRAALGYYRAMMDLGSKDARAIWARLERPIEVPTLALTGALDGCMDTRLHDTAMRLADFPRGLRVVRIFGAGHFLHQEKPEEVSDEILDWLRAAPSA
ncbi:MAG TPA: alpha/beta hydrolase [Polyangiaceae bacterium]|nr:alpha/beta hydrolase [Polyangiaceae bacterium]